MSDVDARSIACPVCGVAPGEMCLSKFGRRRSQEHADRRRPLMAAWRLGYRDGMSYGQRSPESARRWLDRMTS